MQDNFVNRYNLDNYEAAFRNFLIIEQVSAATLKNYLSDFRHFCGWLSLYISANHANGIDINDKNTIFTFLSVGLIEQYKEYLVTNNLPDKTINRRLSSVRKFCSFAINQGWIKENPAKKVLNVSSHPLSSRPSESEGRDPASETSVPIKNASLDFEPAKQVRNDMLSEFKQNLLSQQTNQKDAGLILEDVNEFFTFINF